MNSPARDVPASSPFERLKPHYLRFRWVLLLLVLAEIALERTREFLWATQPHGLGLRTDSIEYLWAAGNLAKGIGLGIIDGSGRLEPMTLWPPLYPTLLAFAERIGVDGSSAARWLGALLVFALIVLAGLFFEMLSGSIVIPAAAVYILSRSSVFWITVLYAMSDPLFIVTGLTSLLLTLSCLSRPARWKLILAGISIALCLLTRFVGGAVLAACCAALLLLQPGRPWMERLREVLLVSAIALVPMLAWMGRNLMLSGRTTAFGIQLEPVTGEEWGRFAGVVTGWGGSPSGIMDGLSKVPPGMWLLVGVGLVVHVLYDSPGDERLPETAARAAALAGLFGVCYFGLAWISRVVVDHAINLDEGRMMFPLFLSALALGVYAVGYVARLLQRRNNWLAALFVLVMIGAGAGLGNLYEKDSFFYRISSYKAGLGLAGKKPDYAGFRSAIAKLPDDFVTYSDNRERFYYLTGRNSYQMSSLSEQGVASLRSDAARTAILMAVSAQSPMAGVIREELPMFEQVYRGPDGEIFVSTPSP